LILRADVQANLEKILLSEPANMSMNLSLFLIAELMSMRGGEALA
jgi:hypothetical protein